jgi:Coenzyme PQQ synthesis protein D (PqqD)
MCALHLDDTISLSNQAVWSDLNGEIAVLHLTAGIYFGIEGAGCEIWKFIQEPHTVGQIIDHLLATYEVSKDVCEELTLSFLDQLAEPGLILVQTHAGIT